MEIRTARPDELVLLQDVENASGEVFRTIGMPEIADDDPLPLDVLTHLQGLGRVWVVADPEPVAWIAVDEVDGCAHVEQVSVHPDRARRGIGRSLLDHVDGWARERGFPAVTLTTFRDVPWNGPYYERLGFAQVVKLTPGLAEVVEREAAHGLDPTTRTCLRRAVDPA
ncbi:GNAT family N-acetyltransferase [Umezawaea sp. Da 62-37]|uniref:GNAT family N-acetyltransferase n=1 Tax=Umezawaea sp. Da 62-37 TaxID=3075927 RepID=UPI0028F7069E|nr:GNAT family N-acetyltransferase [Umezawaea sp. Da 62-37]WNV84347.1 GNAT family N-acetyltransferase [Umezawaea sp. Da 62-37]